MRLLKVGALAVVLAVGSAACTSHKGTSAHLGNSPVMLTFHAIPLQPDHDVTAGQMQATARILRQRLHDAGVAAAVSETGTTIRVSVDAASKARAASLVRPIGELRFRQVLEVGAPHPSPTSPAPGSAQLSVLPDSQGPTVESVSAAFQSIDCAQNSNPTSGSDQPTDYIVGCDKGGVRYLLAPAGVDGQITTAMADQDPQVNQWLVQLSFTQRGAAEWLRLTAHVARLPQIGTGCAPPPGCNGVAIVLDGTVLSAPYVSDPNGIQGGSAQITGEFTQQTAAQLADVLKFGPLPVVLTPEPSA
jgi:preprotein translocase subunit SecD